MAPKPEEHASVEAGVEAGVAADGDRVVISGMAGLYPEARYVSDLQRILYDKVNPITSDNVRWKYNHPEVAQFAGNVPDLDRFDAQFFKVHYRLGINMDSMSRKILEQTFEAIYDAGLSPEHLSGKKVGVFVGSCFSETEKACFYASAIRTGFGIAGCSKSMFANRISYWLNAKGPSVSIDQACCSSTAALEAAYKAISHGECEAAVVGGTYLCLHPQSSVHLGRIMSISKDGKTKSFCEDASGCAKSEAINVLFLQKAKHAKRVYAEVLHVKSEYVSLLKGETGPRYGFYRNSEDTAHFLREFYKEAGVPPSLVEYVEACGSAVPEADKSELEAFDKVLCHGRKDELLVGSVMSNIGYGEAASGISAVTKVLLGYHSGTLAGNLHCAAPRRDVARGRVRVLSEHAPWRRTYAAVNTMSVTGVNAHVLLHGHYRRKEPERYRCGFPRLLTLSNRQEAGVERAIHILKSHPVDPEELALLHGIHETSISGHLGKGYVILDTDAEGNTISLGQRVEYCDDAKRPLWFVYSGMGSQWAGMGAHLMRIPVFAAAIERCRRVLEPRGVDIVHIITSPDKSIFDNILHSFVGIAAVQIGLTDILKELGLLPDNIIGHSVGELGCAYADGCLTAEEMILSAYSRGRVSLETPFIRGSMAAVGLGAHQVASLCPPEIAVACHNSAESCTISGPADIMRSFVAELSARGVFAKEVPCSNIAYHSRYIAEAGPGLLSYLQEVIKTPRARSARWVSTSVPQQSWEEPRAKYSSAEYHTNNLLSPVLFEEALALIPSNAVLVEVAPHGLLQAILKRALAEPAANIPLTRRGHTDGVAMLLDAVGKLYLHGYYPKVRALYPEVQFPVSTGTPLLSHYVQWAHGEKWLLPAYQTAIRAKAASYTLHVSLHETEYKYLRGHVIKNQTLVPFSFVLCAVWDTLAMSLNVRKKSVRVELSDVKLFAQPSLREDQITTLHVSLHRGSGLFEVMNEDYKVACGYITAVPPPKSEEAVDAASEVSTPCDLVPSELQHAYEALYERGYAYSGEFIRIFGLNNAMTEANISWNENWVTLLDAMVQCQTLKYTHGGIAVPEYIKKMVIDPNRLKKNLRTCKDNENNEISLIDLTMCDVQDNARCKGVVIENMRFRNVRETATEKTTLEKLKFIPRFGAKLDISSSLYVLLQIVAENLNKDKINVIALNADSGATLSKEMKKLSKKGVVGMEIQYQEKVIDMGVNNEAHLYENVDIILVRHLSRKDVVNQRLHHILPRNVFIVNEEMLTAEASEVFPMNFYNIISVIRNAETKLELARWKPVVSAPLTSAFTVRSSSDLALLSHARSSSAAKSGLFVLASYPPVPGLVDLVKKWRREPTKSRIHVLMVNEHSKDTNNPDEVPNVNLAFNILEDGEWGGEYFLPPSEELAPEDGLVTLRSEVRGDISSLRWEPMQPLAGAGTVVHVHYTGLNMSDMRRAFGLKSNDNMCNAYGMDFSGVAESGSRVMGLVGRGAASARLRAAPELTWPVPAHWSLEDAATVPLAYMLAYYCLDVKSTLCIAKRDVPQLSVLIHGGAGALGQAAISIALARGWRVFTTVRDHHKKTFLKKLFPQLNEEDIGWSRDASFGDMVLGATRGYGCHLVLCCLRGDLKNISLNCSAMFSTTIDTSQILHGENYSLGMYNLTKERSYVAVDVQKIIEDPGSKLVKTLQGLVAAGIQSGEVRPLVRAVLPAHEAARALRLLAASAHRGRVLLRLPRAPAPPPRAPHPACHVVVCDSGRLGLRVVDALIHSGRQRLQLHFPAPTAHLAYKLREWSERGIRVCVEYGRLEQPGDVSRLLQQATELGAVHSVHVLAHAVHDAVLHALHLATAATCTALETFVILSNDVYRGRSICIERAKSGLPATLLDLSELETFQDPLGGTWCRGVGDAVQRAWSSAGGVLRAHTHHTPPTSLLQHIAALTDIDISDAMNDATLENLGFPQEKSTILTSFLRDMYNIYVEEENVPQLTVEKIKQIDENFKEKQLQHVEGLGTFFSHVESDELLATTEVVYLQTLTNNYEMRDDEYDGEQHTLYLVPGLEGLHTRFQQLARGLKLPALVLQPGLDRPGEGPADQAARYAKRLLNMGVKQPFYLLGYEAGVLVALELAALLEEHGLTGTVFCLGAGPEELRALLERELAALPEEVALQEALARHMCALRGDVQHSAHYASALLHAAQARLQGARAAPPAPRVLRSRVVLLRAHGVPAGTSSLQHYSRQPVTEHELHAPLAHVVTDLRVPAIINQHLHDDLLREYEEKNLCDSYLLNGEAFMALPDKVSDQPDLKN